MAAILLVTTGGAISRAAETAPGEDADRFIQRGVRMEDGVDGRQLLLIFNVQKNFVFQKEVMETGERIYRSINGSSNNTAGAINRKQSVKEG